MMLLALLPLAILLLLSLSCHAWSSSSLSRRAFVGSSSVLISASPPPPPPPPPTRNVDVGSGVDLLGAPRLLAPDVVFPISVQGLWTCQRSLISSDGDAFQAETAFTTLGGAKFNAQASETFETRFLPSGLVDDKYVVMDRGYELASRKSAQNLEWNVNQPDILRYNKIEIAVVQRTIEMPTDEGFGFNELYRITEGPFVRAAQVKRRYRRAFSGDGSRILQGLEIMKTFRVLDGVAGTEFPTSTTKSQIQLTRPI